MSEQAKSARKSKNRKAVKSYKTIEMQCIEDKAAPRYKSDLRRRCKIADLS